jgi:hypothetical protein
VTGLLLAAGFAVILVGAVLFTNVVEWLAGGAVAVWALYVRRRFRLLAILLWAALFAVFATAVGAI